MTGGDVMLWSDDYAIGVKRVDLQHKKMIAMVEDLRDSLAEGIPSRELGNAIKFLVDYTKYHFNDEEDLMRQIGFSDYEAHRIRHREFVDKVTAILLSLKRGEGVNPPDLIGFLVEWSVTHILEEDRKIGREIKRKLSPHEQEMIGRPRPD